MYIIAILNCKCDAALYSTLVGACVFFFFYFCCCCSSIYLSKQKGRENGKRKVSHFFRSFHFIKMYIIRCFWAGMCCCRYYTTDCQCFVIIVAVVDDGGNGNGDDDDGVCIGGVPLAEFSSAFISSHSSYMILNF